MLYTLMLRLPRPVRFAPASANANLTGLQIGNIYEYDFTNAASQAYGSNALKDMNGIYGLYAGDLNADGTINSNDKTIDWEGETGKSGYLQTDVNLDGQTDNLDKNDIWLNNQGKSLQVPQ